MLATLNMNNLTSRVEARRAMDGNGPTVSGLYRISSEDRLLAEQEQFSSATALKFVDLDELPQGNTMGPLNTRSLTDVLRRARELMPPLRKGKFTTENKPNNKHHKKYRQFSKTPGQLPGDYSREYPRATLVEGDDRRYKGLETSMGVSLFAAYDPLDIKNVKYLIVASSDDLFTPRSLFWPDAIFLTAPKLDWGQALGMAISVQRIVSMDPQAMITAGSNGHLQSLGLLARLTNGSVTSNEVMGDAIMTLLSAMTEVRIVVRQHFTRNPVKIVFVLCVVTRICGAAKKNTVCVRDGHYNSRGTIRCDHSRT